MSYFEAFPKTKFNNETVLDITRRAKIVTRIRDLVYDYATYTVKDGERPEDIAYLYYDDATYAWLVLLANDIVDPFSDWAKSQEELDEYIKLKYEAQSGETGRAVLEWAQNETITENIVHYESKFNSNIKLNVATHTEFPNAEFRAVRVYDYEVAQNEAKRQITLVDRRYLTRIEQLVKEALSE